MSRPATLQDVADLCGISRGTASRALSGSGRVSPETRSRVQAAAEQLKYSTNAGARNLRHARAGSIGLWLPRGLRFMEYYMNFAFGVAESTNDRELTVSLISNDHPPLKATGLHVDGFVMADVDAGDELARAILSAGKPVVTSEFVSPLLPQPTAVLAGDHRAATHLLLDRLRASGAVSVAMLTPDVDQMWINSINAAASEWSRANGVELGITTISGIPAADALHGIIRDLLIANPRVDSIVCVAEGLSVGILSTLRELGRAVPDDIQLVSYVDSATLPIVQPPISALDLRPREAGVHAGELLLSLIDQPEASGQRVESHELTYCPRGSTRA